MRDIKATFVDRIGREHSMDLTESSPQPRQGRHLEGSAMVYVSETQPLTTPDGVANLGEDDAGRLWLKPSTWELRVAYWDDADEVLEWKLPATGKSYSAVAISESAPTDPQNGMLWFKLSTNALYLYVADPDGDDDESDAEWRLISSSFALSAPLDPKDGDVWIVN